MRALGWGLIGLPLMIVVVLFALSNREIVTLSIWPLALERQYPLFLVILATALAGFFIGAFIVWLLGIPGRAQAAKDRRRLAGLNRQQVGWDQRTKKDAEEAYERQEEERYAKAVKGEPSTTTPPASGTTLPAPRHGAAA